MYEYSYIFLHMYKKVMNLIAWKTSLPVPYKCIRWNFTSIFFKYNHFNLPFQQQSKDHKTVDFLKAFQNPHEGYTLDI